MVKDYIEVGIVTAIDLFNKKLAEKNLEYNKKFKPFDLRCARMDFRDKLDVAERESARKHGFVKVDEIKIDISDEKLEEYGNPNRFELDEDQEDYRDKVIEGSRTQVIMGHTLTYVCKERGEKIAVSVPNNEYAAMYKKKKKEE